MDYEFTTRDEYQFRFLSIDHNRHSWRQLYPINVFLERKFFVSLQTLFSIRIEDRFLIIYSECFENDLAQLYLFPLINVSRICETLKITRIRFIDRFSRQLHLVNFIRFFRTKFRISFRCE